MSGYIFDMGRNILIQGASNNPIVVDRYAYCEGEERGKPKIIETHNDLLYLMEKYQVKEENIVKMM